jgi:hypothetical protein
MRVTPALLTRLRADNPQLHFASGHDDHWDGLDSIYYSPDSPACHLLHELAHAVLGHKHYPLDIDLLRIERSAWDHVRTVLGPRYGVEITSDDSEDSLDTYRDWLHNRSLCPDCGSSGLQNLDRTYRCVVCRSRWRANDAKTCALRRFQLK